MKPKWSEDNLRFIQIVGSEICAKLKNIYHLNEVWSINLAKIIANEFSKLKLLTRSYYPSLTDGEFHKEIRKYRDEDIREALTPKKTPGSKEAAS